MAEKRVVSTQEKQGFSTQDLILVAVLLAAGAVLKLTVSSFLTFAGMKPNFMIAMYCLAIILVRPKLFQAVLIGFIAGLAARRGLSQNAQLFFKTGLCGGFTTFSTFSLESWQLLKAGSYALAAAYMALSLVLCLLGVLAGLYCAGHLR